MTRGVPMATAPGPGAASDAPAAASATYGPPPELIRSLEGETADFQFQARRAMSRKRSWKQIRFALFVLAIALPGLALLVGPILLGGTVEIKQDGVPREVGIGNLGVLAVPLGFLALFIGVAVWILLRGWRGLRGPGPWIAATPTRLVVLEGGRVRSLLWGEFTGEISRQGDEVRLGLRRLRVAEFTTRRDSFRREPDDLVLAGVNDTAAVEAALRRRIPIGERAAPPGARGQAAAGVEAKSAPPTSPRSGAGSRRP